METGWATWVPVCEGRRPPSRRCPGSRCSCRTRVTIGPFPWRSLGTSGGVSRRAGLILPRPKAAGQRVRVRHGGLDQTVVGRDYPDDGSFSSRNRSHRERSTAMERLPSRPRCRCIGKTTRQATGRIGRIASNRTNRTNSQTIRAGGRAFGLAGPQAQPGGGETSEGLGLSVRWERVESRLHRLPPLLGHLIGKMGGGTIGRVPALGRRRSTRPERERRVVVGDLQVGLSTQHRQRPVMQGRGVRSFEIDAAAGGQVARRGEPARELPGIGVGPGLVGFGTVRACASRDSGRGVIRQQGDPAVEQPGQQRSLIGSAVADEPGQAGAIRADRGRATAEIRGLQKRGEREEGATDRPR